MSRLMSVMSLALILALGLNGSAQDADENENGARDHQGSAERQTIRGTVAGVTVVGETMIDHATNRAAVAQMSYLTILGSPWPGDAHRGEQGDARETSSEAREDSSAERRGDAGPARRRRGNVYLVAITPRTRICETSVGAEEPSREENSEGQDDPRQSLATFERLQLGDQVEVEFRRDGTPTRKPIDQRHGRHRIFPGVAATITILPEGDGDDRHGTSSSSKEDDKSSKKKDDASSKREEEA